MSGVNKRWNRRPPPSFNGEDMECLTRMEPLTPLETLCRMILRAKEYEAQVPTDYDGDEAPTMSTTRARKRCRCSTTRSTPASRRS